MYLLPGPVVPDIRFTAVSLSHRRLVSIFLTLWLGCGICLTSAQEAQQAPNQPQQSDPNVAPQAKQRPEQRARPRFRLTTLKPTVGGEVTLQGRNLRPGSQVTARLTAPNGGVGRMSARVEESGQFSMVLTFPSEGTYRLVVRGQGLQMTRTLEARAQPTVLQKPTPPQRRGVPNRPLPSRP